MREIWFPVVKSQHHLKDPQVVSVSKVYMPSLLSATSSLLKEFWGLTPEKSSADPILPRFEKLEPAHASSVVSFTRASSYLMAAFVGTDLPQVGHLEEPMHNFLSKKRTAQAPTAVVSNPRKKRKNRNKNRFSALDEDDQQDAMEVAEPEKAPASWRPALILAMMREKLGVSKDF